MPTRLFELIDALEYGTKLHISVVFLGGWGNVYTSLPRDRVIHSRPFCKYKKETAGLSACFACRNAKLKRAVEEKKGFYGECVHGIYEYTHPVCIENEAVAVVFVGNIFPADKAADGSQRLFLDSFQRECGIDEITRIAKIIDERIIDLLLLSGKPGREPPLISNIKNYIEEGLLDEINVKQIASAFHYNEKYLGKYFKRETGKSVREYVNDSRLKIAEELLRRSDISVTDIASRTGFDNLSYFDRLFRERYGKSPRAFREELK